MTPCQPCFKTVLHVWDKPDLGHDSELILLGPMQLRQVDQVVSNRIHLKCAKCWDTPSDIFSEVDKALLEVSGIFNATAQPLIEFHGVCGGAGQVWGLGSDEERGERGQGVDRLHMPHGLERWSRNKGGSGRCQGVVLDDEGNLLEGIGR